MKLTVRNLYFPLPRAYLEFLLSQASYRAAMCITEVMVFKSTWMGETGYYVCPRCHITLEREFMSFCDRCGQHLDWKNYKKAAIIYPGTAKWQIHINGGEICISTVISIFAAANTHGIISVQADAWKQDCEVYGIGQDDDCSPFFSGFKFHADTKAQRKVNHRV